MYVCKHCHAQKLKPCWSIDKIYSCSDYFAYEQEVAEASAWDMVDELEIIRDNISVPRRDVKLS